MRQDIRRARQLYAAQVEQEAVSQVITRLQRHLTALLPSCSALIPRMTSRNDAARLEAAVESAQYLLANEPTAGVMARLVHMQLLSDSVAALSGCLRTSEGKP
ncbi:DUF6415 family natural product biosynthesis protein [Streptomyces sp. NPDC049879]|uniref:DUF6415 family natural product biosynthesis protein n=1 Tax=Streptomyces sp. NPDC049879 TaxID=3365598 RepID=UPI00379F458C